MKKIFLSALSLALLACTFGAQAGEGKPTPPVTWVRVAMQPDGSTIPFSNNGQDIPDSLNRYGNAHGIFARNLMDKKFYRDKSTPCRENRSLYAIFDGENWVLQESGFFYRNQNIFVILGASAAVGATTAGLTHLYNKKYKKNVNKLKAALIASGVTAVGTTAYFYFSR